jgi:hypothetical protein
MCVYIYTYIWSNMYLCVHLTCKCSFYIWGKCDLSVFKPDLLHLTQHNFIFLCGWIKVHFIYIYIYIYHIFLIHSSVVEQVGCFQSLDIVNSATINMDVQVIMVSWNTFHRVYVQDTCLGSYGSSISSFLRDLHTPLCSDYTNWHSHQYYWSVPFSPYPHHHFLLFVLLMIAILTGVR